MARVSLTATWLELSQALLVDGLLEPILQKTNSRKFLCASTGRNDHRQ